MSLRQRIAWTLGALGLAVLISLGLTLANFATAWSDQPARDLNFCTGLHSLGVPLTAPGLRDKYERALSTWSYQLFLDCRVTPADDQAVVDWLREHAQVHVERVQRLPAQYSAGGTSAWVLLFCSGPQGQEMPAVPWEDLGYQPSPSALPVWAMAAPYIVDGPPGDVQRLICLGFLQLGFLLVGLVLWWRNRRLASEAPPRGEGQVLPAAVGVAAALVVLAWVSAQATRTFLGPAYGLAGYLRCLPSVGWFMPLGSQGVMMTVQPPAVQLVAAVIVVLGAPLAQEIFFRGGLVGMWTAANRFKAGAVLSALAAAVLGFDWIGLPVAFIAGLALAWLYHWSRSLLAPLVAHVTLNAAILSMVYGLIPFLPDPVEQICGRWKGAVDPAQAARLQHMTDTHAGFGIWALPPPNVEFLRGGYVKGGIVTTHENGAKGDRSQVHLAPRWYEWVDPEHLEVRWEKTEQRGQTVTQTLQVLRYQVAVSWQELRLTRENDGQAVYYRRAD